MKGEEGHRRPNRGGGCGRGRGGGRGRGQRPKQQQNKSNSAPNDGGQKILVLHGSRQTGQLLLGRMDKLRKTLQKDEALNLQLVAPDGPFDHPEDTNLRQWWNRQGNNYEGLETTLQMLQDLWESEGGSFVGILGFSQGARLAQLIALLHQTVKSQDMAKIPFQGLQFVILVAGYDCPMPDNWIQTLEACNFQVGTDSDCARSDIKIEIPSLHIWGASDSLITPKDSQAAMESFDHPSSHEHPGGHHVPMKAPEIRTYLDFLNEVFSKSGHTPIDNGVDLAELGSPTGTLKTTSTPCVPSTSSDSKPTPISTQKQKAMQPPPDEETAQAQQDEVESLMAIYPEEVTMASKVITDEDTGENIYKHPISYRIALHPEEGTPPGTGHWPKHPISLGVTYPYNYPSEEALPEFKLLHNNNVMEFASEKSAACMRAIDEAANAERGMPCVLSCFYAAREFLDSGEDVGDIIEMQDATKAETNGDEGEAGSEPGSTSIGSTLLKQSSLERIHKCNMEGLGIAESLLGRAQQSATASTAATSSDEGSSNTTPMLSGKGGSWTYTIGLVGKPSAGKSTFFNTASAFARQRDDADNVLGGATMAPHPFTTIDPNIGFCLVPAPKGACPEEDADEAALSKFCVGSSHGRDAEGRRLLPVLLKDVAGLVPGAYQGRGRGNKFLNDLTDANVLVHVVDSSGMADAEGNVLGEDAVMTSKGGTQSSQPLEDLAWIGNELVEWVFTNLMYKWDTVIRRGRSKLSGMFSGYGQTSAVVSDVLNAVEKHMEMTQQMDRALERLDEWDTGDVHRLVSAFLGVRFPMALALNKFDLESSAKHVEAIQAALPVHGAHVGVPLSARSEMNFVRFHILQQQQSHSPTPTTDKNDETSAADRRVPIGTWQCLHAAMSLREPVLVFPVMDMTTYQPLAGLAKHAVGDPSLPSAGMIACLQASGGSAPTLWDPQQRIYANPSANNAQQKNKQVCALRDVLVMKPGSTVEDVFLFLKRLGALGGDFVRAEGAGDLGETSKQIKKDTVVNKRCRILKIMTTKRTQWQQQHAQNTKAT